MSRYSAVVAVLLLVFSAGCGGGGGSSAGKGAASSAGPSIGGPVNAPVIVTVLGGGRTSGIDIQPPAPASSPAPNAQFLGTRVGPGTITASNTGATIQRNIPTQVVLFGPGLTSTMTITFGGPSADISITSPIQAVTSTGSNPVPGVLFTVLVSPTATLGARSVILRAANNDITTFTGGLEIVP